MKKGHFLHQKKGVLNAKNGFKFYEIDPLWMSLTYIGVLPIVLSK